MMELDASAVAYLNLRRGDMLAIFQGRRSTEVVAAYRSALHAAPEHNSHFAEMVAALRLFQALIVGAAGPRWSLEEVRGLLATAKSALAKCKPWMPPELHDDFRGIIADGTHFVNEAAARGPEQAMLPALEGTQLDKTQFIAVPKCSGCGQHASTLKKCSRWRTVAYCSHACQVQHWKEGGHKQQCAQLAAGSTGTGSSSSSRT